MNRLDGIQKLKCWASGYRVRALDNRLTYIQERDSGLWATFNGTERIAGDLPLTRREFARLTVKVL